MNPANFVRHAGFAEVLSRFRQENSGAKAYGWTLDQLETAQRERPDQWTLVSLSKPEVLGVMIRGGHRHSIPGAEPLIGETEIVSVAETAQRLRTFDKDTMPECWNNILYQKERNISRTHFFLKHSQGQLWHMDGFHRMLAWVLFQGDGTVPAFVAG